jgi:hypothetical protein
MRPPERQPHGERRPHIQPAFDIDRSTVQPDQFVHQCQPDAGAFQSPAALAFDAVEAVEDVRQLRLGDADAGVAHRQYGRLSIRRRIQADLDPAREGVFERIGNQIENDPLPHFCIDIDLAIQSCTVGFEMQACAFAG